MAVATSFYQVILSMALVIRSTLFYIGLLLALWVFAPLALFLLVLPCRLRYHIMTGWGRFVMWWLAKTCHLTYQVRGLENLPRHQAAVVLSKHQSAWETIAFQEFLPFQTWVLKRELLWIPLFGWALATLDPVSIDRKNIRKSLQQVVEQGQHRLARGQWIIIFPEGTRVAAGQRKRYGVGGAMLAARAGCPVVPIAHNSGKFWPKHSFLKYPGKIQVVIGELIETKGKNYNEINKLAEDWIEKTMQQL